MFSLAYFEISGVCNACCPWCQAGASERPDKDAFIPVKLFAEAIEYMLRHAIIGHETQVGLYNWGEPFLHPQLKEITTILSLADVQFGLSTNASVLTTFDEPDALRNLQRLSFSMCGFSQASYDRIQGLGFEAAKRNIATMIANFRDHGFREEAQLAFHVYRFNQREIGPAREFCEQYGIVFRPYYALLDGRDMMIEYLTNAMPPEQMTRATEDLELGYVPELVAQMPGGYVCPQYSRLTIDERCAVRTCCLTRPYDPERLGYLFDMTCDQINAARRQPGCEQCLKSGAAYWIHEASLHIAVHHRGTESTEGG